MKTKKGFTLVELIVTITLLALFGVTIGITLNKSFKTNEEKEYKEFISKIESSANLYLNNNYVLLNQLYENKGFIYITPEELKSSGLLDNNIINPKTKNPIDKNDLIKVSLDSSGAIKIEYPITKQEGDYLQAMDIMLKIEEVDQETNYCWNNINTISLGYIDSNGDLDETYLIPENNIKCSIDSKFNKNDVKFGTYEINYEYKNKSNEWKKAKRSLMIVDRTPPICGNKTGESTTWTKEDRTISVACTDSQSGCEKATYSNIFNSTAKESNISIKDKAGNTNNCPVNVYIDKTNPTCGTITGASTTWTKDDRTISVACSDPHSGCEKETYSTTYSNTAKTSNITIKDKADNTNTCSVNVYVDKTNPTCGTITGASTTWTKDNRTISVACSDSDSGCEKSSYSTTYSSTAKTSNITIKDKVGNTNTCTVNTYVDKTNPTCGTITGASTTWTKDDRTISVACSDSDSGCEKSSYSSTYSSSTTTANITIKDKAGNTNTCSVNVYVDKANPTCELEVTTDGVKLTYSDAKSGVAAYGMGTSATPDYNSKKSYSLTTGRIYGFVKDKVGHEKKCYVTLTSTLVSKYKKKTRTCNRSISTYKCTRAYDSCPSGYSTYSGGSYKCRKYTSTTYYYTKTTKKCTSSTSYTSASTSPCKGIGSESTCKQKGCTWNNTGGAAYGCGGGSYYTCSSGTVSGSQCKHVSYSTSTTTNTNVTSCSASTGYSSCGSSTVGKSNITCTQTSSTANYSYSNYKTCSSGSDNGNECVKTGQSSKLSGWSCSADSYDYAFGSYGSESTVSSCTASSFSCNSSNYDKTYTHCSASEYKCEDGYTKLNNTYCYK